MITSFVIDSSRKPLQKRLSENDVEAVANGAMRGYEDMVLEGVATDLKGDRVDVAGKWFRLAMDSFQPPELSERVERKTSGVGEGSVRYVVLRFRA